MKKGIYLCARKHRLPGYNIIYNDIEDRFCKDQKSFCCDCRFIDLSKFDYIIATPPCNYYSRANYRRDTSSVALSTKDLLPYCLENCIKAGVPFIVENVNNKSLLPREFDKYCYRFDFGGHTFWTNVYFTFDDLIPCKQNKQNVSRNQRDGNYNVHIIIKRFLHVIHSELYFVRAGHYVSCAHVYKSL